MIFGFLEVVMARTVAISRYMEEMANRIHVCYNDMAVDCES